jgi:transposase-like protein
VGQLLHGCATTTKAVPRAIHASQASVKSLAAHHGINPQSVQKWRHRASVADAPMSPKHPRSTALASTEEAVVVAFQGQTLLALCCTWTTAATPCRGP